jgi:galactose mutarotase-like enzyme
VTVDVRVDDGWSYQGQPVIRIENEKLRADVLPGMGAKILHLVDKAGDRDVLWRNPRVPVRPGPLHADVDDYFAGGWDDAFPTGDACLSEYGERLPYMGEVWNLALRAVIERAGPDEAVVVLDGHTPITPARWTRTLTLRAAEPVLRLHTRIENVGHRPFSFSWGSHPALAVHEGMRLDVPAETGEVTDAGEDGPLGARGVRYRYPLLRAGAADALDVRRVPAASLAHHALHALTGLSGGWIAATDPAARRGFGVVFDPQVHTCVWQWMAYGGFRGWYHAILEPWTAPQPALADARAAGQARILAPGEVLESEMTGVLYAGVAHVASLAADGTVTED